MKQKTDKKTIIVYASIVVVIIIVGSIYAIKELSDSKPRANRQLEDGRNPVKSQPYQNQQKESKDSE